MSKATAEPPDTKGAKPEIDVLSVDQRESMNSDLIGAMQAIVSLNNDGVAAYEEGTLDISTKKFQRSLDKILDLRVDLRRINLAKGADVEESNPSESSESSSSSSSSKDAKNPIQGWSAPTETADDQYAHLFSRMVLLEPQELCDTISDTNLLTVIQICTTCILFNKSISLHSSDPGEQPLSSAVSKVFGTYERTFNAFGQLKRHEKKKGKGNDTQLCFHLDVLVLALFNNMGALFLHEMAQYHDAAECFRAGSGVLLRLQSKQIEETLTEKEISEMCMNTWMVPMSTTPAA